MPKIHKQCAVNGKFWLNIKKLKLSSFTERLSIAPETVYFSKNLIEDLRSISKIGEDPLKEYT
ncbi:MAG TPA: hypothetical protein DIT07_14530 [Sphingobacteriaceae bacterium]|nr:hypothetical protein [Sphingobacteriaceae bacterium]